MSMAAPASQVAPSKPRPPAAVTREYSPLAAVLSYLIPGLGQVCQGRVAKGVLFFVCVYALYFYGMWLGSGSVRLRNSSGEWKDYRVSSNVYLPDTAERSNPFGLPRFLANLYNRPQFAGQFWVGVAAWPALWQYAAYGGNNTKPDPLLGYFQRTPDEESLNAIHVAGDKLIELGWVYTVIAGVLNIMVIYDAFAGPAFLRTTPEPRREGDA